MTQKHPSFSRWISYLLMTSMLAMGLPMQSAFAGMVATGQVVSAAQEREKISAFLDRTDVLEQLQQQGISSQEARARVNSLTDEEAHHLAGKLDQLPAGGDILGLIFTVFIVLLFTDILGFTKVFSFTHAIKR